MLHRRVIRRSVCQRAYGVYNPLRSGSTAGSGHHENTSCEVACRHADWGGICHLYFPTQSDIDTDSDTGYSLGKRIAHGGGTHAGEVTE